ncbi:MAG: RluA family pseudouridine synthase [Candidatus Berkelbacteria bacterium]
MDQIKIIFENNDYVVVDKPAGVLVHPTAANETNTLVDWLVNQYPDFKNQAWPETLRAGIVHRLDKDTSGLIILAKNPETLERLQEKFKNRDVQKTYQCLVAGHAPEKGKIDMPIVRDSQKDMMKTQAVSYSFTSGTAREAVTEYKTIARYKFKKEGLSLVEVYPHTGRMHQIRVHMKHEDFPLVGDQMYFNKPAKRLSKELDINRQFLHAVRLEIDGQTFTSELADDLKEILTKLKPIE